MGFIIEKGLWDDTGFLNLNVAVNPYTPNYPTGLSGISGLIGWYDASQSSSVIQSGGLVTQWNNLFNGATQGAAVTPAFVVNSGAGAASPSFLTNQSYQYNVSTGTQNGIGFDGATNSLILQSQLNPSIITNSLSIVVVAKQPSTDQTHCVFDIVDQQTSNFNDIYWNYNIQSSNVQVGASTGYSTTFSLGGRFIIGLNLAKSGTTTSAILHTMYGPVYTATNIGAPDPTDFPWGNIILGSGINLLNPANTIIGEVLIYSSALTSANFTTIYNYLNSKWS